MSTRGSRKASAQQDKVAELSCAACNERKVRCDKGNPCSTCQATGVVCVPIQRKRLPRGRHVKENKENKEKENRENKELRGRLARLESLIASDHSSSSFPSSSSSSSSFKSISASISTSPTTPATPATTASPFRPASTSTPAFEPGPGNAFWTDLVDKHPTLHGALTDPPFDRDHLNDNSNNKHDALDHGKPISQQHSHLLQQRAPANMLGIGFSSNSQNPQSYIDAALALRPAPAVCQKLCQAYLHRVDPIIRIFHRPSVVGFLLHGKPYLGYHDTDPVLDVVRSAVFLVAVVSLTEERCKSMFNAERTSCIAIYRLACELALDRAGLITTEDITVLQSFVLYLIAVRSHDRSRTAWTLFPIAVRLATALELNTDSSHSSESFFEQQMRRRLWYAICVLDVHSSFDRGSEPVISHKSKHPRLPFNINDSEFGPDSEDCFSDGEGLTDMTKALIQYHAQATSRALGAQEDDTPSSAQAPKTMSPQQQLVEQFELHTRKLLRYCDPNSSPYAWSTFNGSLAVLATLQLWLRRPMNHNGRRGDTDPTNILHLATTALERDIVMRSDSRGEPFRWIGVVHWHPLAVAIAECYVCDNVAVLRHVWPTIETSFEYIGKVLAEYRQGMLWKPLERLMVKTRSRIHALPERFDSVTYPRMSDSPGHVNISATLDPSAYGSTTMPLSSSSNSMDAMLVPFSHTPASSGQNNQGGWTMTGQADASWHQTTPLTPVQTAAMSAPNKEGGWMMDSQADASFWQQMTPSMSDAGWDAWDDFINNFNVNWNDDMMVP